jgi:hypothetical protein
VLRKEGRKEGNEVKRKEGGKDIEGRVLKEGAERKERTNEGTNKG